MANVNDNRKLSINRVFNVPVEILWEMWTRPEHIAAWWGPEGFTNTISKMEVKEGGEWEFIMHGPDETDYKNKHIFRTIEKYKKLVLEHITAPKFVMEINFERQGDQTRVKLTHTGLASFGTNNPNLAKHNFEQGWNEIVGKMLPVFLEKA